MQSRFNVSEKATRREIVWMDWDFARSLGAVTPMGRFVEVGAMAGCEEFES